MKFNWLDLILMLIAFRGVYTGYRRGILGELVFIAGSFASFFFAYKYSALLGDHLAEQISLDIASSHNFCFWSVVFGGLLASLILGRLMMRLSRILFDSVSDKLVGSIAGLLR
ncbi:MAG: CvpA family protein, partial [Chlamydiota bacterium]|nr:CvpA family protein [Chlamydiota bacterium]